MADREEISLIEEIQRLAESEPFAAFAIVAGVLGFVVDVAGAAPAGTRVVVMPGGPPPGTATASAAPAQGLAPAQGPPSQAQLAPVPGMQPTVVPPLPAPVTVR